MFRQFYVYFNELCVNIAIDTFVFILTYKNVLLFVIVASSPTFDREMRFFLFFLTYFLKKSLIVICLILLALLQLVIERCEANDSGEYHCTVNNDVIKVLLQVAYVRSTMTSSKYFYR